MRCGKEFERWDYGLFGPPAGRVTLGIKLNKASEEHSPLSRIFPHISPTPDIEAVRYGSVVNSERLSFGLPGDSHGKLKDLKNYFPPPSNLFPFLKLPDLRFFIPLFIYLFTTFIWIIASHSFLIRS